MPSFHIVGTYISLIRLQSVCYKVGVNTIKLICIRYRVGVNAKELICIRYIPDKKRNAPLRTFQLSGISQLIGQFSLYQFKVMQGTAASHVFCNLASKLC